MGLLLGLLAFVLVVELLYREPWKRWVRCSTCGDRQCKAKVVGRHWWRHQ